MLKAVWYLHGALVCMKEIDSEDTGADVCKGRDLSVLFLMVSSSSSK